VIIGGATDPAARQQRAAELGYSETVFIDDARRGVVDIYTPSIRLSFAGHPLVGVSWLLRARLGACDVVRPGARAVPSRAAVTRSWRTRPRAAAALQLTAELGRSLTVHQGVGSEIRTRMQPDGRIAVGGRVRPAVEPITGP
jgi:Phenazine biosynthesis-like protein